MMMRLCALAVVVVSGAIAYFSGAHFLMRGMLYTLSGVATVASLRGWGAGQQGPGLGGVPAFAILVGALEIGAISTSGGVGSARTEPGTPTTASTPNQSAE